MVEVKARVLYAPLALRMTTPFKGVAMVLLVQGRLDVVPSRFELNTEGIPVVGSAIAVIDFLVEHARSPHALVQVAGALVGTCFHGGAHDKATQRSIGVVLFQKERASCRRKVNSLVAQALRVQHHIVTAPLGTADRAPEILGFCPAGVGDKHCRLAADWIHSGVAA